MAPGVQETCPCEVERIRRYAYFAAKLPEHLWQAQWDERIKVEARLKLAAAQVGGDTKRFLAISGRDMTVRYNLATLFVRDLILRDFQVEHLDFVNLVSLPFASGDGWMEMDRIIDAQVLWLRMEDFPRHRWNQMTISRVFHTRRYKDKPMTLVTCEALAKLETLYDIAPLDDPDLCAEVKS